MLLIACIVVGWLACLLIVLALCVAAADGDRQIGVAPWR